ncbi:RNA polymerase subunit sigma, partial [Turicibacter sanguinis]|nr:RNA polymerase subunit sigma [Turicibacter sanguinis]
MKKDTYQSAQMVVERLIEDYGQDVLKIAYLYVKD